MLNPSMFRITLKSMFFIFLFLFSFIVKLHCYDNPCKNNGTCHNHSNNYTCECRPGFMGEVCQGKISWRFSDVWNSIYVYQAWSHFILVLRTTSGNSWRYLCLDLFTCISVIDHCYDEPCLNNGSCVNSDSRYQCICPSVSAGPNCEGECHIDFHLLGY